MLNNLQNHTWIKENLSLTNSKLLGNGGFGLVESAFSLKFQEEMAIKSIRVSDDIQLKNTMEEIIKINVLNHPNILKVYEHFPISEIEIKKEFGIETPRVIHTILIVLELGFSSLGDYLNQKTALTEEQLTTIIKELSSGLAYAHGKMIVHQDLKPANIILVSREKEGWTPKISDWGSGFMFKKSDMEMTFKKQEITNTPAYCAPEIRKFNGHIPEQKYVNFFLADIYSMGLIFLNCCGLHWKKTQEFSNYIGKKHDEKIEEILIQLQKERIYSSRNLEIIKNMLKYEPTERKIADFEQELKNLNQKKLKSDMNQAETKILEGLNLKQKPGSSNKTTILMLDEIEEKILENSHSKEYEGYSGDKSNAKEKNVSHQTNEGDWKTYKHFGNDKKIENKRLENSPSIEFEEYNGDKSSAKERNVPDPTHAGDWKTNKCFKNRNDKPKLFSRDSKDLSLSNTFQFFYLNAWNYSSLDDLKRKFKESCLSFLVNIGKDKIKLLLPKCMNIFDINSINIKLDDYIKELLAEIEEMSIYTRNINKNNNYPYNYKTVLKALNGNPYSLFSELIKMYRKEWFLYKELNENLRCCHLDVSYGFKIKFYYIGLMVALQILSQKTKKYLASKIEKNIKTIKLFRGSGLTKEELEFYRSHLNALRQINCFLSTSLCKKIALRFCESSNSQLKALFELELMCCASSPFTLLESYEFDYKESEALIHSGCTIQINGISEISENKFHLTGRIFPSGINGFLQYFAMNPNSDQLNLENEGLGKGDIETMRLLKKIIIENNIKKLDLSNNGFGEGPIEIFTLLKDALVLNKSITILNLINNGFDSKFNENIELLKDILTINRNIKEVYLLKNNFSVQEKRGFWELLDKRMKIIF